MKSLSRRILVLPLLSGLFALTGCDPEIVDSQCLKHFGGEREGRLYWSCTSGATRIASGVKWRLGHVPLMPKAADECHRECDEHLENVLWEHPHLMKRANFSSERPDLIRACEKSCTAALSYEAY